MSAKSQHKNILLAVLGFVSVVVIVAVIGYFTIDRTEDTIQGEVEVSEYRVACKFPGRITDIKVKEGDAFIKAMSLQHWLFQRQVHKRKWLKQRLVQQMH